MSKTTKNTTRTTHRLSSKIGAMVALLAAGVSEDDLFAAFVGSFAKGYTPNMLKWSARRFKLYIRAARREVA